MKKTVGPDTQVKASGGIRDYDTCMAMIEAGADRIGCSGSIKIADEFKNTLKNPTQIDEQFIILYETILYKDRYTNEEMLVLFEEALKIAEKRS